MAAADTLNRDVPERIRLASFRASTEDIFLVHARFLDRAGPSREVAPLPAEVGMALNLAFHRHSLRRMVIALGVTIPLDHPYSIEVMYAGDFVMADDVGASDVEDEWRRTAAQLAPIVLYPYLRELISDLTRRSQAEPLTLPVLAFSGIDVEAIEFPAPPSDVDESQTSPG